MRFNVHIRTKHGVQLKAKLDANGQLGPDMKKITITLTLEKEGKQYDLPLSCNIYDVKAGNIYCELDDKGNKTFEDFAKGME